MALSAVRAWRRFIVQLHESSDQLLRMACAAGW
jgi:uncharacterized protein YjeT (DUF2065 family)